MVKKFLTIAIIITDFVIAILISAESTSKLSVGFVKGETDTVEHFAQEKAVDFIVNLLTNYNDNKWLCKEHSQSTTYWIYNDNVLAFQILSYIGSKTNNSTLLEAAEKINRTIKYNYNISVIEGNDRIEVLFENQTITPLPYSGAGYYYSPIIDSDMQLGPNLIKNPSVERGDPYLDYWYHSSWCNRTCWSDEQARTGSKSLKLVGSGFRLRDEWRSEIFNVTPFKSYVFRFYIKGTVTGGEWYLTIRWFNMSQPLHEYFIFENNTTIGVGEYSDWTQIIGFNFTAPPNAVAADMLFRAINATGTLYADDFEAAEIIDPGTFVVRNDVKYIQVQDWEEYADLLMFEVLNRHWRNQSYDNLWEKVIEMFNESGRIGLADKAFRKTNKFETYKLALLIITASIINKTEAIPEIYNMRQQIFGKLQNKTNGGVVTHYLQNIIPDPNATENIETTCLTIYACLSNTEIPLTWIPEFSTWLLVFMFSVSITITIIEAKSLHYRWMEKNVRNGK